MSDSGLLQKYRKEIVPAMQKRFGIDNVMATPKIEKVVLNVGMGKMTKDDKFVETALVAGASWLVSGDKHLLRLGEYRGIKVISARTFLDMLAE